MLGKYKLIVDDQSEVYRELWPWIDGDFWNLDKHEIVPGAVYVFCRESVNKWGPIIKQLAQNGTIRVVQDFAQLEKLWETVKDTNPEILAGRVAEDLATQLDLPMNTILGPESAFFKQHYRSNWHNQGVMTREMDVIRRQEGW